MAITFVDFTATSFANATSGNFSLPAGFADGDLGVFWFWSRDPSRTFTKPSAVDMKVDSSDTTMGRLFVGYRHLVSTDTTFGWTCSNLSNQTINFGVSVFRGTVASGDPFEAQSSLLQTPTSEDVDPPSVAVVSAGACVIVLNGKSNDGTVAAYPTGYVAAGGAASSLGNDASCWLGYKVVGSAGTEDPGTWTFNSVATDNNLTWTAAIAPAGGAAAVFVPRAIVF